uniref:NADH-ubiquinone oxidoreductase chain 2 n=1 Tax=Physignathus cocincinus TaxID=52200 RepID=O79917_PHYCN|nr:NADH dehydrogenase subunit 2 [Physignathus cocincinus]
MSALTTLALTTSITTSMLITASANHWLTAWIGLELNTISILPIIMKQKNLRSAEAAMKYLLTQAIASAIMLLSSSLNAWQTGLWDITQLTNELSCTMMTLAITIKIGAAPAHFWLPEVMQGTTIPIALLMATLQKIPPLTLLYMMANHTKPNITLTLGMLSILAGGWGGINQTQLRKMMAYSSITHLGWTMTAISISPNIAMLNIIIYMTISTPVFLLLSATSTKTLQATTNTWSISPTAAFLMTLMLLSLAGLPPLAGFTPKLAILNILVTYKLTPLAMIIALSSLLSLLFYLRTTYILTSATPPITTQSTTLWRAKTNHNQLTTILAPMALFNMTMMPALIS